MINVHSEDFASFAKLISWANKNRDDDWDEEHGPKYVSIPLTQDEKRHPRNRRPKQMYDDNRVTIPRDVDENHIADAGWSNDERTYLFQILVKPGKVTYENVPRRG